MSNLKLNFACVAALAFLATQNAAADVSSTSTGTMNPAVSCHADCNSKKNGPGGSKISGGSDIASVFASVTGTELLNPPNIWCSFYGLDGKLSSGPTSVKAGGGDEYALSMCGTAGCDKNGDITLDPAGGGPMRTCHCDTKKCE